MYQNDDALVPDGDVGKFVLILLHLNTQAVLVERRKRMSKRHNDTSNGKQVKGNVEERRKEGRKRKGV